MSKKITIDLTTEQIAEIDEFLKDKREAGYILLSQPVLCDKKMDVVFIPPDKADILEDIFREVGLIK